MKMKKSFTFALITLSIALECVAQTWDHRGQLSGWTTINGKQIDRSEVGLRYLPELSIERSLSCSFSFSSDMALNVFGSGRFEGWNKFNTSLRIKPYRLWLRFASHQFEGRIGLQKINFGSATLIRPLMWFDQVDPRDPLQLTDGVYALLLRYYFLNNVNCWFWALYGNAETKGWELIASDRKKIELGGRWQLPIYKGEMGLSFHHRQLDLKKVQLIRGIPLRTKSIPEYRLGVDGKWDAGIGIWLEAALIYQKIDLPDMKYQRSMTIGLDYTFNLGNGLHGILENFAYETADQAFGSGETLKLSALSLGYPISLLDRITGMIYYDWKNETWYRFISWQRSYDRWQFFLIGFWNPERFQIYQHRSGENLFAGKGARMMFIFTH
ncbi:MAG: hypothetical protein ONB32_09390 [candidate division KSB1 bacterium]|nr:hypothetical protein [candidate division KSB1 bacterium]MDZ7401522.1 hypothetical protein [candidate division KSB1 bacterium]